MGRLEEFSVRSRILEGNRAGESAERLCQVYVPEGVDQSDGGVPVLYLLAPWTSGGRTLLNWRPFKQSLPEQMEALIAAGKMGPCLIVSPDLYTSFGGSQFVDGCFFGNHAQFLAEELFVEVESRFPACKGSESRALLGRSSGGFGALRFAMDYPGRCAAIAAHSADMGFDHLLRGDLVTLCRKLEPFEGDVARFLSECREKPKLSSGDVHLLMLLGVAGFYSPNSEAKFGFDLPVDLYSGVLKDDVWQEWLTHDPVVRFEGTKQNLAELKGIYLECGRYDQYNLLYGARQLHKKLEASGIRHVYKEFNDNHSGTDYRYYESLPVLYKAISR